MTHPEVIDRGVLKNLLASTGNDSGFVAELIDTYLQDAAELVAEMARALCDDNPAAVQRAAHSLKSNSASLGALKLASLCEAAERRARDGLLEGVAELLTGIEAGFVEVERELRLLRPA